MRRLRSWLVRLASLFGAGRSDAEIVEELQAHRELLAAEYVRAGLSPDAARRRAALEFGSLVSVAGAYQDRRGLPAVDHALRDARMAMRSLTRTPVLSLSMVLVLGLGVGLSTAIVAVFHAIVWADLPLAAPDAVVRITRSSEDRPDRPAQGELPHFAYPELETYRQSTRALAALTGVSHAHVTWRREAESRVIQAARVTGDYFRALPVTPAAGRMLTPADARQAVAVISYRLWTGPFDAVRDVVGRTIWLDQAAYTIVGVTSPSFVGTEVDPVDVWLPLETALQGDRKALTEPSVRWVQLFGRLAPGTSVDAASSEAALIAAQLDRDYPGRRTTITLSRASRLDRSSNNPTGRTGMDITASVAAILGLLFLICGSNAAALLLARGAARQKEIAVRVALGASGMHLVRQLFAEVSVIALASALMGVLVSVGALRGLAGWLPMGDLLANIKPGVGVFAVTLSTAFVVALLFGVAPARQALQVDCLASLKGSAAVFGGQVPALRLRRALISIQVAVSVVLLVAAAILGRGAAQAWQRDLGYVTKGLYVVHPDANWEPGAPATDKGMLGPRLADALAGAPGVRAVAQSGRRSSGTPNSEAASGPAARLELTRFNRIDDKYFATLGVSFVAGRTFLPHEEHAVIVNSALARRFWTDEQAAIGQMLYLPPDGGEDLPRQPLRVIGATPTLETTTVGTPDQPTYYLRLTETEARSAFLLVRAEEGVPIQRVVLQHLRSADANAFAFIAAVEARRLARTAPIRLVAGVAGLIGLLALVVAAVGIHGVISYTVACRTRDIGIHRALGARNTQVLRLILGWAMRGVAIGATGALLFMIAVVSVFDRQLRGELNGVHPLDPGAFLLSVLAVLSVIAVATYWPTRRALGMAPLAALRRD